MTEWPYAILAQEPPLCFFAPSLQVGPSCNSAQGLALRARGFLSPKVPSKTKGVEQG